MCDETASKSGCKKTSCGCGSHGHQTSSPDPRSILMMKFGAAARHECGCSGGRCPRHYLALTGFALAGFLLLHLIINSLALWPEKFQSAVDRNHSLGAWLPVLEVGLIFIPLVIHVTFGLRTLRREKLKFGVAKHHHGSHLRQWLQRVSAVILFAFILFHVITLHRWLGGRFNPHSAFDSASRAIWQFWRGLPTGHPVNLLVAEFYLLGIVAAAYHVGNGITTGAEVLGLTTTATAQKWLMRACLVLGLVLLLVGLAAWHALTPK
jgi:succinate dehydrogenase / fumarate reductase cytochrome b subunit